MHYHELIKVAGVVVDGGQKLFAFSFKVDNLKVPFNRGRCGGGWWTDQTPIFLFYSLNWGRSNFSFSLRLLFVSGLMLKVIVFLGIQP